MKKFLGLRGKALNLTVTCIAGIDFLLFGYGEQTPTSATVLTLTLMCIQIRV
jgi:hypothetical protein